ncbi:MAG TPA: GNAT family N-acetyltransferase [Candidatus Limnocylindrales bacterium]|nr:GNAT family N-acetyltransferase [Candidatus Limnocylindrales bacterium]
MTLAIRRAGNDEADLATITAIVNAVMPEWPTSIDQLRWSDETYPGTVRLIAELAGRPVGAATVGRIFMYPPDFDGLWGSIDVLPDACRKGIGGSLLRAIAGEAAAAGKGFMHIPASELRPEGIAFLVRRGFVEIDRHRIVRLPLAGLERPPVVAPDGLILTDLARRPDLVAGVHRVAVDAFPHIPGSEPMAAGDLAEFRARDVDRPGMPPGAFVVGVDAATGEVAGYASLLFKAGSTTEAVHDMTAVRAAWRGRGLATAMKRATIAWAIDHGLAALETGNDEENLAMRAVNARLGYRPAPDDVTLRGSVAAAMMEP